MLRRVQALAITSCILVLAGCEVERVTFGEADGAFRRFDPWLETDRTVYVVHYTATTAEVDIEFTFRNRSRATLAVPRCSLPHRPVLDKLIHGEWHEVFTPFEECIADPPLLIPPGAVRTFTYRVRAGRLHASTLPRFETSHIPGIYRLRWDVYEYDPHAPYQIGWPLRLEHRVSNEFRLVH